MCWTPYFERVCGFPVIGLYVDCTLRLIPGVRPCSYAPLDIPASALRADGLEPVDDVVAAALLREVVEIDGRAVSALVGPAHPLVAIDRQRVADIDVVADG